MSEPQRSDELKGSGLSLLNIMREVRSAEADRADVVVELRDAERMRLDMLVQELEPVLKDVDASDPRFDFVVSSGLQPRFWIDAVSHVAMGRDRRTYRFLRDTRLGRVVLAETSDIKAVAEQVARYIAERMIERQRLLEGEMVGVHHKADNQIAPASEPAATKPMPREWSMLLGGLALIGAGAVVGLAVAVAYAWLRGIPLVAG
ncbi:hypothetical protein JYU29_10425 [Tianweitania sp. BSSL-BM11]|uniref:Uncharacterized protein n=1 Tax=Tianweitania aestuarii TaxID=2814886 RepID=A0ABS5RVK9_9HYPH|nr:hypothetical protein [Tianweitania aestuarii]MBS9721101.1 hypothetical protein [Tianweitania aestuarii]